MISGLNEKQRMKIKRMKKIKIFSLNYPKKKIINRKNSVHQSIKNNNIENHHH